jgi:hypothetical protein
VAALTSCCAQICIYTVNTVVVIARAGGCEKIGFGDPL